MTQPGFSGHIEVETDHHQDVVIRVNGQEFLADLMFMNQFALCETCDSVGDWQYFYPKTEEPS